MKNIPEGMPRHQIDALARGESVIFNGEIVTSEALPSRADALAAGVEKDELLAHYEKENQELRDRVGELESKPQGGDVSLYEGFLPTSASEVKGQSLANLKALASIRGMTVEGEDKAAYVAALSPKEGE